VLKEKIQEDTHDSIEDATTALKLWRKYQEFVDAGVLEQMLDNIYATGRESGSGRRAARTSGLEVVEIRLSLGGRIRRESGGRGSRLWSWRSISIARPWRGPRL